MSEPVANPPDTIASPHPLRQSVTVDLRTVTNAQALELIELILERAPGTLRIIEHEHNPEMAHLPEESPGHWNVQHAVRWAKVMLPDEEGNLHWTGQIEVAAENGSLTVGYPASVLPTLLIHSEWEAEQRRRERLTELSIPLEPEG